MNKRTLKEYRIWKSMKARCYAPSQTKGYYKIDGIKVCDRWKKSFENFISDMGPIPGNEYSIERIDFMRDYEPNNCKWIMQKEQPKNRRNSIFYTLNGKTMCLKDWSRCFGRNYQTVYMRIYRGKTIEEALEIPNDLKVVDDAIRDYYGMKGAKKK